MYGALKRPCIVCFVSKIVKIKINLFKHFFVKTKIYSFKRIYFRFHANKFHFTKINLFSRLLKICFYENTFVFTKIILFFTKIILFLRNIFVFTKINLFSDNFDFYKTILFL